MNGRIFEIKRFAVHDGDGIRTTVFFKGCPLKCVWCHNPEGLSFENEEAFYKHKCIGCGECKLDSFTFEKCFGEARVGYGRDITIPEILNELVDDVDFYDASNGGVTLSGGECLMQADFCAELLKELKNHGINTAVDTCGFVSRDAFDKVIPYTDTFLYDIKAFNEDVHKKCTGVSNKLIRENLAYLDTLGKRVEIRIPYVPKYNSDEIEAIAHFLSDFKNIVRVRVLPYHNYAGSKYEALGMKNTLPNVIPTDDELNIARTTIQNLTGFETK